MSNELTKVFNNGEFGSVRMVKIEGKPYAVGVDVAKMLEYAKPSKAVADHCKGDPLTWGVIDSLGRTQETRVIPQGDIIRLITKAADQSKNPTIQEKAKRVESWIFDEVIPTVLNNGSYTIEGTVVPMIGELQEQMKLLSNELSDLKNSALFKQNVNPRYIWERLIPEFFCAVDKPVFERYFYDAIGDWIGTRVKRAKELPDGVRVRDYAMSICDTEDAKQFVSGIASGRMVQSHSGHWVDLQGIFANSVEQSKIWQEFNHQCAYCGSNENLVIEHINPQRKYAQESPDKVDLIGNCTIACPRCNEAKNDTMPFTDWYNNSLPYFSKQRLDKILKHMKKYEV